METNLVRASITLVRADWTYGDGRHRRQPLSPSSGTEWSFRLPALQRADGKHRPGSDLDVGRVGAPLERAGRVALHGVLLFDDDPPARVDSRTHG